MLSSQKPEQTEEMKESRLRQDSLTGSDGGRSVSPESLGETLSAVAAGVLAVVSFTALVGLD